MNNSIYSSRRFIASTITHFTSSGIPTQSLWLSRSFSYTPCQYAIKGLRQSIKPRVPAQMSMKNRVKDTMSGANREMLPDDVGLLPGTFIRPVSQNMPSIFSNPKVRLRMEWLWLKMKFINLISLFTYCKFFNKKVPMRLRERNSRALELHKEMYTAFAKGDMNTLKKICCQGIYQTFSARISRRAHNSPPLRWTLHSYKKFPSAATFSGAKVMSDRASSLPDTKGFGIRQTVVRIQSKQSLITPSASEDQNLAQTIEKQQDCTEYVVLQRFMVNGVDGDWKVWGLAEETTEKDLETDPLFAPGLSLKDRLSVLSSKFRA